MASSSGSGSGSGGMVAVSAVDLEPVKAFLQNALTAKLQGNNGPYNVIVQQFRVKDDQETLWRVILALSSFTSLLTQRSDQFKDLLSAIFSHDWKGEARITQATLQLIVNIVSTNAIYLSSAFQLFARSFLPNNIATASSKDTLAVEMGQRENKLYIHETIQHILRLIPTGQSALFPILAEHFPHKRFSKAILTEYVQQLLTICDYLPALQERLLDLILSRCLEIDVEIIIEDSGEVRLQRDDFEGEEDFYGDFFQTEEFPSAQQQQQTPDTPGDNKPRIPKEVCELADKLDSMLMLVVQYCQAQMIKQPSFEVNKMYMQLWKIFESRLLLAHKSKFVQFILFFVTSGNVDFAVFFTKKCIEISFDHKQYSSLVRQAAVMYTASFVSRANFLPVQFIHEILSELVTYSAKYVLLYHAETMAIAAGTMSTLEKYRAESMSQKPSMSSSYKDALLQNLQQQSRASTTVSGYSTHKGTSSAFVDQIDYDDFGRLQIREHRMHQHEVWYAMVQSTCYILCFYGVELASCQCVDPQLKDMWAVIFSSRFDPLRYTLKSIRNEFLKLVLSIGLFTEECWESFATDLLMIESEHSPEPLSIYPQGSNDAGTTTTITTLPSHTTASTYKSTASGSSSLGPNTLESFFPFDPCLLNQMHNLIETYYRSWRGVPGLEEEEIVLKLRRRSGSADIAIPTGYVGASYVDHDGVLSSSMDSSSMVSSLAYTDGGMSMSLPSSFPGERMIRSMQSSGPGKGLDGLRDSTANAGRTPGKRRRNSEIAEEAVDEAASDAYGHSNDEFDEDDEDEDEFEDEDVFAQGMELTAATASATQINSQHSSMLRTSVSLTNISSLQTNHSNSVLTSESLRALSQGYGQQHNTSDLSNSEDFGGTHRRPRLYSIGSTGSW